MKKLKVVNDTSQETISRGESKRLFRLWRSYDLASAVLIMTGLALSTLDYEINYSPTRSYRNCHINTMTTQVFRYLSSICSLVAIICILLRYFEKLRWKHRVSYFNKKSDSIAGVRKSVVFMCIEIIVVSILPYPHVDGNVYVPLRFNHDTITICYKLSEILYCLMFLRFFIMVRALINFSSFQNDEGRECCKDFRVKPNMRYLAKCLWTRYPVYFLTGIAVLSLFIFALTLRVFERVTDDLSHMYYSNPMNALWFMVENMTTLGYGEFYPYTYPARIVCVLSYFAGSIIFALFVSAMQQHVDLDIHQRRVYKHVMKIPLAATMIKNCLRYYLWKKRLGTENDICKLHFKALEKSIDDMKSVKSTFHTKQNKRIHDLRKNVKLLNCQVSAIDRLVTSTLDTLVSKNKNVLKMTF
ncbi:hypothetical protein SteCoe_24901 [Stentor coeruleus]|uniref:Potassium channel domain-containing protein n=1 Tax=Stentor coeruleus TaxID=5963 RepID=A0A1R2BGE3_9CILI|nr:hypothetical protein SteCoe_24901 [Stentor coeruleus]